MTNINTICEEAKSKAIYRLSNLALKAERKQDYARAEELRRRIEILKS